MSKPARCVWALFLSLLLAWSFGRPSYALLPAQSLGIVDGSAQAEIATILASDDEFCGSGRHGQSTKLLATESVQQTSAAVGHGRCCKNPSSQEPCRCETISSCNCLTDASTQQIAPLTQQDKLSHNPRMAECSPLEFPDLPACHAQFLSPKAQNNDGPPDRPPR
jgi:hypothetical protein